MSERTVISVTELNNYIKDTLEGNILLQNIAVRGEISNYRPNTSGHLYFSLKDEGGVVRCVMFRYAASKLKYKPDNGMKVVAVGSISAFPRDGQYQLYLTGLIPDGVGDLYMAFEQLKSRLGAEGLFAPEHKKPLPVFPMKIGLVTSPTGAAVRDMLRILKKRWPAAKILIVPVKVQGAGAAAEIAAGIRFLNDRKLVQLIITGRGGGSIEDLWCFNEEIVARAIYDSQIPVISAVGHEPDVTIADYAADLRAATPSNGAELAVPDSAELGVHLDDIRASLLADMASRLKLLRQRVETCAGKKVYQSPESYINERTLVLDYLEEKLAQSAAKLTERCDRRLAFAAARLDAMSPLKVLGRGYSIAMKSGDRAVRSVEELELGEKIKLRLADGNACCEVTELNKNE